MHRNLTPFRAHGREWYNDSATIRHIVAEAIRAHGEPYITAYWSKPIEQTAANRRHSGPNLTSGTSR